MKNSNKFTITPVTPFLVLLVFALTIALFMRGGEVLTALSVSTTNSSAATVNITNSAPTCGAMVCYDTDDAADYIKLVGGGTRYAKCNATCNDENGWGNIQNYTGQMYNAGSGTCTAYNTNCYVNATCQNTTIAANDTGQYVTCSYLFWYNADNTSQTGDWTGRIKAGDVPGTEATATDTIDVQALLAIGVDSTLSFGSKSAGTNDTTLLKLHNLYNYGNIQMDFQVNGSALTCGIGGTIAAEYLKVSLTAGDTFVSGYPLTATLSGPASSKFGLYNLDENVTTTTQPPMAPNKSTFWGVGIPPAKGGNCQGTIWFAAVLS